MDTVKLTGTLTHTAGDTACGTGVLHLLALQMVLAGNDMLLLCRNHINDMLRAGLAAGTAARTFLLIHNGHAVHDMDGIELTCLHTGTVAAAGIRAFLLRAVGHHRKLCTIRNTGIAVGLLSLVAGALTSDEGHLLLGSADIGRTHDGSDLLCRCSTAYGTLVHRCLTLGDGLGTAVTSGEAAGTAVVSGKRGTNLRLLLIYLNLELLGSHTEEEAEDQSSRADHDGSDNNDCSNHRLPP